MFILLIERVPILAAHSIHHHPATQLKRKGCRLLKHFLDTPDTYLAMMYFHRYFHFHYFFRFRCYFRFRYHRQGLNHLPPTVNFRLRC
jgi:hypothetical protein